MSQGRGFESRNAIDLRLAATPGRSSVDNICAENFSRIRRTAGSILSIFSRMANSTRSKERLKEGDSIWSFRRNWENAEILKPCVAKRNANKPTGAERSS